MIHASSIQDHEQKLRQVFEKIKQANLKLEPLKCEFMRNEVNYLGHVISKNGVSPNEEKVKAVENFPIPKTPKGVYFFSWIMWLL